MEGNCDWEKEPTAHKQVQKSGLNPVSFPRARERETPILDSRALGFGVGLRSPAKAFGGILRRSNSNRLPSFVRASSMMCARGPSRDGGATV